MFGFFVAAASFVGLVVLAARRRRYYGGYGGRGLYRVLSRLETSPGQEKVIRTALEDLRQASRQTCSEARDARPQLAEMIRAEQLDKAALGSWFETRHDSLRDLQSRIERALGDIHDVLDDRQKKELAHLVERGPRFGFGFGHSHHHASAC